MRVAGALLEPLTPQAPTPLAPSFVRHGYNVRSKKIVIKRPSYR
jgi:hypothetical protein